MSIRIYDVKTDDYSLFYYGSYTLSKIKSLFTYSIGGDFEAQKIIDGVYLGNINSVYDYEEMKKLGITHIISVVAGFYPSDKSFNYLILNALDTENTNLSEYFEICNNYIDEVLENNNKILIHCMAGKSRSVTILCAYIIKKFGMNVENSLKSIKYKRDIIEPNQGFLKQLKEYYNYLYSCNNKDNESCY